MKLTFYHKPGCVNNEKQKGILLKRGFSLDERNLLDFTWDRDILTKVFKGYLVSEWFNESAPKIKDGSVRPADLTYDEAIDLILENPIYMKRPIIEFNSRYIVGFSADELELMTGVFLGSLPRGLSGCAMVKNER